MLMPKIGLGMRRYNRNRDSVIGSNHLVGKDIGRSLGYNLRERGSKSRSMSRSGCNVGSRTWIGTRCRTWIGTRFGTWFWTGCRSWFRTGFIAGFGAVITLMT